ncbi:uncharacterized protein LOC108112997 [Drosophila eugracilis]|uniref:uncharacterized protein LOC108112997 n=1 Tax=Drosophila eugracilis TaxID=29029 RepID=UPI0007E62E60|nr:uncharacterized protein LOC108112997 [Drosophila eugracilis]
MDNALKSLNKPNKFYPTHMDEDLKESVELEKDITNGEEDPPIVYDYMKYPSKKGKPGKLIKSLKPQKTVTFKMMVELVTFTENWKVKMCESKLRSEEEQAKNSLKRCNY